MYWGHESANYFEDIEIKCSVCRKKINGHDLVYLPRFTADEQDEQRANQIEMLFKVDPFNDFQVCENCIDGHCGEVKGKTANSWLEEQFKMRFGAIAKIKEMGGMNVVVIGTHEKKKYRKQQ